MRRALYAFAVVLTIGPVCHGQRLATPTFAAYPSRVERRRAKQIDFGKSPGAATFRTRLSYALRQGINFAGHYILTGWGCGTGCIYGAIIDGRTGRVFFPEELAGMATAYTDTGGYEEEPVAYRRNSRLIIIAGVPGSQDERAPEKPQAKYYFEWANNRLRFLKALTYEPR